MKEARSQPSLAKAIRTLRAHAQGKTATRPLEPVPVMIAYGDVPSARHALARISSLVRNSVRDGELHPMLWRFDQLDDSRWRDVALRDAARARALVLAMSDEAAFCPRTQSWITTLLSRLRGCSLNVLALVGEQDAWTITLGQPPGQRAAERSVEVHSAPNEVFASVAPKALRACAA